MDSSLPVLVARLPDRRALARLVRAALRNEIVHVPLVAGPQRTTAHTLDLHVAGQPPLALLAEPAGAPANGRFPLRVKPLYRAQTAQLQALLDGWPEDAPSTAAPTTPLSMPDSAPIARAMAGAAPPPVPVSPPKGIGESGGTQPFMRPPVAPVSSRSGVPNEEIMAPPRASALRPDLHRPRIVRRPTADDPKRTAPSAEFASIVASIDDGASHAGWSLQDLARAPTPLTPMAPFDEHGEHDAEDGSLSSVSVVFEPENIADRAELAAARAAFAADLDAPISAPPFSTPSLADPADLEEGSLSVSVVFEADDLIAAASASEPPSLASDPPVSSTGNDRTLTETSPFFDAALADFRSAFEDDAAPVDDDDADSDTTRPPKDDDDPMLEGFRRILDLPRDGDESDTLVRGTPESTPPAEDLPTEKPAPRRRTTRRKLRAAQPTQDDEEDTATLARAPVAPPPPRNVGESHPPLARSDDPALGRRVAEGKYIIESLIGSGAAGAVYRATHRELRRTVAIKLLHPHYQHDPQFMASFRDEALAASQLDHPNVMRVLDFGQEQDGLVYIVMEYLSGRTVQNLLDEERRLPPDRAIEILTQVCAALSVAHDHGIIHRDIKPDNIMLVPSRDDEGATFELVKVCDFGIAALKNPHAQDDNDPPEDHIIAGTPEYMSPEQARGTETDARSDVYACGILLYELVTGRPPFIGDHPAEIIIKQLEEIAKAPSVLVKGLDPILEEIILRAIQKDPEKRHQSAREMRVELKELIDPGEGYDVDERDELSIVENVPVLDDPASGFPGFFIAFSSAILRFGRFERGHHEAVQATKELQKALKKALRGRAELTFARRDANKTLGFWVMSGTAEIVDLRRLLGSQLMGSFGDPFAQELAKKGIVALTLREGIPETELQYVIEMLLGPFSHEDLRKEFFSKPLRNVSLLFVTDVVGRSRKLSWKVGLCTSRISRDLRALCNIRGISLKKMRETRDELIGGVARLLTRGDEVRQFIFNADLVDEAVANLRGFSSFQIAPLIIDHILHPSCAEAAILLLEEFDEGSVRHEVVRDFLVLFAQRLITERSEKSDAAVAQLYQRKIVSEEEMPRDLKESIRATTLADALVRDPAVFLQTLDLITDPDAYTHELVTLEAAMAALARRSEAVALVAVMSTLARHAKGAGGKAGPREAAALRTMKTMLDRQRLLPIAGVLLGGTQQQREAARHLVVLAGSIGAQALFNARETVTDPAARAVFVQIFREMGAAAWSLVSQVLPRMEVRDDAELALVEDLLRTLPERPDPALGEAVAKFLPHPLLRPTALAAIGPLWGERAKKPLVEALEFAEEPTRIIALAQLRRLHAIDEYVFSVLERFLTMRGIAGDELRVAAAAAVADVPAPLRTRGVQLLAKAVEGKRGFLASLRGGAEGDDSVAVVEAMGRALLSLDKNEGVRAVKARIARSEGDMRTRLIAVLTA